MPGPLELYRGRITAGALRPDIEQEKAAAALDQLYRDLAQPPSLFASLIPARWRGGKGGDGVKGVYLYGGVGRGKSMLMDLFFDVLPESVKKRRVHFHAFMIETQDWLHRARSGAHPDNILFDYAKFVANGARVLCFDEFHVTDVADAMILSRLFTTLFELGVVVVATSNWPPSRLYEGGLQRERFLPFIALVEKRLEIVHLDSACDYRSAAIQDLQTFLHPLSADTHARADSYFAALSRGKPAANELLRVKGRDVKVRAGGGTARFTFQELCEQPLGAEDYLEIARRYHDIILENIPKLGYDRNNETKRLMTFVDVAYDLRRRVFFTAEAAADKLYSGEKYDFEFERTISRLKEMQSSAYTAG